MKTRFTIIILMLITISITAQQGINYKTLIKDGSGNVVANQSITVQFIIYKGSALNINVYQETHTPTTDANGIIILNIGEGSIDSGVFTAIDWASDEHHLNIQINTGGGLVDLGTTQFMAVPYALQAEKAANVTGLETLDEGNGIGWRLVGRDPANYGNIGEDAIDLSISTSASTTRGATGDNSTAMGNSTTASGDFSTAMGGNNTTASGIISTAMGSDTTASGNSSTAMGNQTTASGNYSTAMGLFTTASGDSSTAMGNSTTASGNYSTAMGLNTTASGRASIAMGQSTIASSFASVAIGRYNIGGGSPTTVVDTDPIFEIGIGTGFFNNKRNAFTVLKNGHIGIDTATPTVQLQITGGSDAKLTNGSGYLLLGSETSANIVMDNNEIMARTNGVASTLFLQHNGGDVQVNGSLVHSSDIRLKKDIVNLPYGLNEILQLQPKAYNWKNRAQTHKSFGLIAQDVQSIIKEIVHIGEDENKTLSLSYTELIPVLIKAIHEQQEIIDNQNSKINNQNSEIKSLQSSVSSQQSEMKSLKSDFNSRLKQIEALLITKSEDVKVVSKN